MDGYLFDAEAVPCDGCGAVLADLLALVPTRPLLAAALIILILIVGADAAHPHGGVRR